MICYGIADVIGSYGFGFVVKYIGRLPCFVIAAVINYSMIFTMLFWTPNPQQYYVLFIIAAFWGLADAVWQTQINGKINIFFININHIKASFH
jgi:predicted MFS family arabinose efflux permease